MNRLVIRQKLRAFFIHLVISIIIAFVLYMIVFKLLYPSPLDIAEKVLPIFSMMLGIDLVLGPVLTFIVYRLGKKTLKMDLAVIALIQLAGLIYGLNSLYISRPSFIVFESNKFILVNANEVVLSQNAKIPIPLFGVHYVTANFFGHKEPEILSFIKDSVMKGMKIEYEQKFYNNLDTAYGSIQKYAKPVNDLNKNNTPLEVNKVSQTFTNSHAYLPLITSGDSQIVLFDRADITNTLTVVNLKP